MLAWELLDEAKIPESGENEREVLILFAAPEVNELMHDQRRKAH